MREKPIHWHWYAPPPVLSAAKNIKRLEGKTAMRRCRSLPLEYNTVKTPVGRQRSPPIIWHLGQTLLIAGFPTSFYDDDISNYFFWSLDSPYSYSFSSSCETVQRNKWIFKKYLNITTKEVKMTFSIFKINLSWTYFWTLGVKNKFQRSVRY
jgi:hypothetical protein